MDDIEKQLRSLNISGINKLFNRYDSLKSQDGENYQANTVFMDNPPAKLKENLRYKAAFLDLDKSEIKPHIYGDSPPTAMTFIKPILGTALIVLGFLFYYKVYLPAKDSPTKTKAPVRQQQAKPRPGKSVDAGIKYLAFVPDFNTPTKVRNCTKVLNPSW